MQQKDILVELLINKYAMKIADIKTIIFAFRLYRYNLYATLRFINMNFIQKNIHRKGGYIFIFPRVNCQIHQDATIEVFGNTFIGLPTVKGSNINSSFIMKEKSKLVVNKKCELLEGCDIQLHRNGLLVIDSFHSNIDLEISCGDNIKIGNEVTAGRHVRIKDFNGHNVSYEGYPTSAPISIGNHIWLCTGSCINPGVSIGNGAVVADNANVVSNIDPHTFNQGNPSQKIKSNIVFTI